MTDVMCRGVCVGCNTHENVTIYLEKASLLSWYCYGAFMP